MHSIYIQKLCTYLNDHKFIVIKFCYEEFDSRSLTIPPYSFNHLIIEKSFIICVVMSSYRAALLDNIYHFVCLELCDVRCGFLSFPFHTWKILYINAEDYTVAKLDEFCSYHIQKILNL